jgi:hypothetical protein
MKLLTKEIEKAFEKQGWTGDKKSSQIKVICKLFNPTGGHTWWLYERDSQDPDIFWAFVCDGNPAFAELGTVRLSELQSFRGRMGLVIERDSSFKIHEKTVQEVIDEVKKGRY